MGIKITAMHKEYGRNAAHQCKECCNFLRGRYHDRFYSKCIAYGLTHSEASDWTGRWTACGLYGKDFDTLVPKRRPLIEMERGKKKADEAPLDGQLRLEE